LPILWKHMRWRWFMRIVSENFRAPNLLAHWCFVGFIFELGINVHHVPASETQSRGVGLDSRWKNYLRCHAIHSKSSRRCGYNTAKIGWGRRLHNRPTISFEAGAKRVEKIQGWDAARLLMREVVDARAAWIVYCIICIIL
jgi:hypothetical protein